MEILFEGFVFMGSLSSQHASISNSLVLGFSAGQQHGAIGVAVGDGGNMNLR